MSFRCQLCGSSFSFQSSLADHLQYTHRMSSINARQMAYRTSSSSYRSNDLIDTAIDVGVGMAIGAALGGLFSSDSCSHSDSGWSGGGGESGGGGASGDW